MNILLGKKAAGLPLSFCIAVIPGLSDGALRLDPRVEPEDDGVCEYLF